MFSRTGSFLPLLVLAALLTACHDDDGKASTSTSSATVNDVNGQAVTFTTSAGSISNLSNTPASAAASKGLVAADGAFSYQVSGIAPGSTVTVTVNLPAGTGPGVVDKCSASACSDFAGAVINGDTVALTLTDGGPGDADGVANGTISDPDEFIVAKVTPTLVDFGNVAVGTDSNTKTVGITNVSKNKFVSVSGMTTSGGDFAFVLGFTQPLSPGQSGTMSVKFHPNSAGPQTGTFSFMVNGIETSVDLAGTGVAAGSSSSSSGGSGSSGGSSGSGSGSSSSSSSSSSGGTSSSSSGSSSSSSSGSSSGGASSAFWLPFVVSPAQSTSSSGGSSSSGGGSSGSTGLLVVPSNNLSATPALVTGNPIDPNLILPLRQSMLNGSGWVLSSSPYALLYGTSGAAGGDHLYRLPLTPLGSSPPVPSQVSNLNLSGFYMPCAPPYPIMTNLGDPTTTTVVIHTAGPDGSCNTADDYIGKVSYGDSATTAPTPVPLAANTSFTPLTDANGNVVKILALDASGNLNSYANPLFTNPQILLKNVSSFYSFTSADLFGGDLTALAQVPSVAYTVVTFASGQVSVYYFTTSDSCSNGNAACDDLYDAPAGAGLQFSLVKDSSSFYFGDFRSNATNGGFTQDILKAPLDGSAKASLLDTYSVNSPGQYSLSPFGSNGTNLFLSLPSTTSGLPQTGAFRTLLDGMASTPANFASFKGFLSYSQYASAKLFAGYYSLNTVGSTLSYSYYTQILNTDQSVAQPELPGSAFMGFGPGGMFQVQGITDTDGQYGGGTPYYLPAPAFTGPMPFTDTSGVKYVLPAHTSAYFFGVTSSIGAASFYNSATQLEYAGLLDLQKRTVVPVQSFSANIRFAF